MKTNTGRCERHLDHPLKGYSADILFFGITIFIPLFMENGYLNLTQAKAHAIYVTVVFSALALGISAALVQKDGCVAQRTRKLYAIDYILLGFALILSLSTLSSQNIREAFFGSAGWRVGSAAMLSLIYVYFMVSNHYNVSINAWIFVLAANTAIFLLTIFHSMGIDVLGLHKKIDPAQFYLYVSTLGNVNWLSGYLCLMLPVFFVFFLLSARRTQTLLFGSVLLLGLSNVLLCGSDSVFLGIWTCTFFALPFALKELSRVRKLGVLFLAFGINALLIGCLPAFAEKRDAMHGVFSVILDWKAALPISLLGLFCCFALPLWWKKLSGQTLKKITLALELLMLISLFAMIFMFVKSYDESWGNYRGRIWNTSAEVFQCLNLKDKLIGVGPEMLRYYYNGLTSHSQIVLTAHNEFLQWLLTTGILGAACQAAMSLWLIASYFRCRCWEHKNIAFFLPLMAYLGQATVNSPNAMNIALFYLFLALYRKSIDAQGN